MTDRMIAAVHALLDFIYDKYHDTQPGPWVFTCKHHALLAKLTDWEPPA